MQNTPFLPLPKCVAVGTLILIGACTRQEPVSTNVPTTPAEPQASQLDIKKLQAQINALSRRVARLQTDSATVRTDEENFAIARTIYGPFTVAAKSAVPYLDGFKVRLRIGNLTAANFADVKLKIDWGPEFDSNNPDEYLKAQKTKEISLTAKLIAGSFNEVDVVLTPAKPSEVISLEVGIEASQIELRVK